MTSGMHEDEVPVPDDLVRRLVDSQFPQWGGLPLRRLPPLGTDHQLFRLGDELLVRMPRIDWAADQAHSDWTWLKRLEPHLPLRLPVPVALGEPGEGYPWAWTVVPWIEGETPTADNFDEEQGAHDLGGFVRSLRGIDPMNGPVKSGTQRGVPLVACDDWVRTWADRAGDRIDRDAVLAAWDDALAAPPWDGDPVWIAGDIQPGNVIVRDRRAVAVIDFGALGLGDPAADLAPMWAWFGPRTRETYRDAVGLDEAAWRRGRGWALVPAVSGLVYYWDTAPHLVESSRRTLRAVVGDS